MNVIMRHQAITLRLDRYYTNIPCKRGHLSERYTVNSCCIECLHPKFISDAKLADRENHIGRETARRQMKVVKVDIHRSEVEHYTKIVHSYAKLRAKCLLLKDVRNKARHKFTNALVHTYGFRMYREDMLNLLDIARDLNWRNMSPDEQTTALLQYKPSVGGWVPPPFRA